jgi:protein pelota
MDEGIASLFIINRQTSVLKAKIEKKIPKNKTVYNSSGKAKNKFFEACLQAILAKLNLEVVSHLIIGSPGFHKDNFLDYVKTYANKNSSNKLLSAFLSKIITVRASSGFQSAVKEILEDETVKNLIKESILGKE